MPSEAGQLQLLDNGLFATIAIITADHSQPDSRAHSRKLGDTRPPPAPPGRPVGRAFASQDPQRVLGGPPSRSHRHTQWLPYHQERSPLT